MMLFKARLIINYVVSIRRGAVVLLPEIQLRSTPRVRDSRGHLASSLLGLNLAWVFVLSFLLLLLPLPRARPFYETFLGPRDSINV